MTETKPFKMVHMVLVSDRESDSYTTRMMLNKVFDAPKYMAIAYGRATLKALGAIRIRKEMPDIWFGYAKGNPQAIGMFRIESHILRDRTDPMIAWSDKRGKSHGVQ